MANDGWNYLVRFWETIKDKKKDGFADKEKKPFYLPIEVPLHSTAAD
jgi:hypothetical protein